ncbi:MAG: HEPN domain-containing protein [bacterium]|nr:HEPN domain-containing protein [bacterium]
MDKVTRELITGYIEKSLRKLEAGERLFDLGYYEDAVSRVYYAVFHIVQALLLTEGERAETHKGVVTLFGLLFIKTGRFKKDLGRYLVNLKDDRESGDYEVLSYIDKETAEKALKEGREFIEEALKYLKDLGLEVKLEE